MFGNKKISIFLVEDSEIYAMMLDQALKNKAIKHSLTVFESGEECLKHLQYKPDIIFLDYFLPGMNGIEILKQIKSSTYGSNIPVVMISGQRDIELAVETFKAGAQDYIVKDEKTTEKMAKIVNEM